MYGIGLHDEAFEIRMLFELLSGIDTGVKVGDEHQKHMLRGNRSRIRAE